MQITMQCIPFLEVGVEILPTMSYQVSKVPVQIGLFCICLICRDKARQAHSTQPEQERRKSIKLIVRNNAGDVALQP